MRSKYIVRNIDNNSMVYVTMIYTYIFKNFNNVLGEEGYMILAFILMH
jgi:hypothetical protein